MDRLEKLEEYVKKLEELEELKKYLEKTENEKKITFEDIKRANETIQTTDIKGKEYAEVNQRIKAFRMVYPTGKIEPEMLKNEGGVCIFKAWVCDEKGNLLGVGHAYEKENSTFINKTSYIENCETSAVGRALGMAGFGIDTSVASAEEVANAIENQKSNSGEKNYKQILLDTLERLEINKNEYAKEKKLNSKTTQLEAKKLLEELTGEVID